MLQKVDVGPEPQEQQKRGLRGRIAANKKQELTSYMQSAVGLVKTYVPPDPAKLQAAKEAGNVSLQMLEPGKRVGLVFQDYEKPGDKLTMIVDPSTSQPLELKVATYLDSPSDVVSLEVSMAQLDDATTYPSVSKLNVAAKNLTVKVTNSGYRKSGT